MERHALQPAGRRTINKVSVPVYTSPTGCYVEQLDRQGRTTLMSLDGALAFKGGPYPLHESIQSAVPDDGAPLFRSEQDQSTRAKSLLRALMRRLIETRTPLSFAEAA